MSQMTTATTITAKDLPTQVPSLMVPMQGRPLLVPNVAVAEIVPFDAPIPVADKPAWFLGHITWRGVKIPVVSVVQMRGEDEDLPLDARIAVFNGLSGEVKFYGVVTHGIPRLVRVRANDIETTDGAYTPLDDAFVAVGGELSIIPNLERIEAMIAAE